jgi:hypothetical protein
MNCGIAVTVHRWLVGKMVNPLWQFLTKLNILLAFFFNPKELKIYVYTKICPQISIIALFIIVKLESRQDVFQ